MSVASVALRLALEGRREVAAGLAATRAELAKIGPTVTSAANTGAAGFDKMTASAMRLSKFVGGQLVTALKWSTLGVGALTAGVAYFGLSSAINIQSATANLATLTGSTQTAANMVKQLNQYGNETTFDTGPLTDAAQQMLTYGIATKDVLPDMKMLGDIAMGNQDKLSGLAYVFAQVQGAGKLQGQDLMQMINQGFNPLNEIAKTTGKSMGELREEMSKGQISFDMVKQAMVDATAKGGQFYNGAKNGSKTVAGAWGNMTGTISSGLGVALQPVLPLIQKLFGNISDLATGAMPALERGVRQGIKLGKQLGQSFSRNGLDGVANTIQRRFGVDAPQALELLRTELKNVWTIVTKSIVPAFNTVSSVLPTWSSGLHLITGLLGFLASHTTLTKNALVGLVAVLTVAKLVTTGITVATKAWSIVQTVASTATKIWAAGQWLLNAALTANPIGLIVVGVAALIAVIVAIATKTTWFQTIWSRSWGAIKTAAVAVWNWIRGNWPLLLGILTGPIGIAVVMIHRHWDDIKAGAGTVKDWITGKFDALVSFFSRLPGRMAKAAAGLFDGIKSAFRSAINWVIGKWNDLAFTMPSVNTHIPGVGTIGGWALKTPNIQMLEHGGRALAGHPYIVGERRAELFVPDQNGKVLSRVPQLNTWNSNDIDAQTAAGAYRGGPVRPSRLEVPVYLDSDKIAEVVLDNFESRVARA